MGLFVIIVVAVVVDVSVGVVVVVVVVVIVVVVVVVVAVVVVAVVAVVAVVVVVVVVVDVGVVGVAGVADVAVVVVAVVAPADACNDAGREKASSTPGTSRAPYSVCPASPKVFRSLQAPLWPHLLAPSSACAHCIYRPSTSETGTLATAP